MSNIQGIISINPSEPSVTFHIKTSHLICSAKQMTGIYMRSNFQLKWVKIIISGKSVYYAKVLFTFFMCAGVTLIISGITEKSQRRKKVEIAQSVALKFYLVIVEVFLNNNIWTNNFLWVERQSYVFTFSFISYAEN